MATKIVDYALILRHPDARDVLLFESNKPPVIRDNPYHFWQSCEPINQGMLAQYGLRAITLRPLFSSHQKSGEETVVSNVYLMRHLEGALPRGARWVELASLTSFPDEFPIPLEQIRRSVAATSVPAWYRFEWFDALKAAAELMPARELRQLRSWERSAVWRIDTPSGSQFLKSVPPLFAHEIPLTRWLHHRFPDNIPKSHPVQLAHSTLLEDYGSLSLMDHPVLDRWEDALRTYARIQIACIEQKPALIDMGAPVRGLPWIAERLDPFLADDTHFARGLRPLSKKERATLSASAPLILEAIQRLRASPLPETLEHGDFWAGQIFVHDEHIIISDWSDATISCPLFSLPFLLEEVGNQFPGFAEAKERLTDGYLAEWRRFGDLEELRSYQADATVLYGLHNAMRYHHDILPAMGQKWEMENMVNYGLRLMLKALRPSG
jgi:hypothetical protein